MTEMPKKAETKGMAPGVCVPWEQIAAEFEPMAGNKDLIKSEWEKLDTFAYIYLWWWVHR